MTLKSDTAPVITLAATVIVALLVGCGGEDQAATDKAKAATTKAEPAAVADELVGTWTRRVARRNHTFVTPGVFTMKVLRDGSVEMYDPDADVAVDCVSQMYCEGWALTARNGKLTIGETTFCTDPGNYSYEISSNRLATKRVEDACSQDRPQLFAGATWRRQS
jgi:hypothetical protein